MTNPNNAIGTNAAYGGRTSPNAFNDVLGAFTGRGILSGWQCSPNTGMSVVLGGDGEHRDVAIAEDNAGNKLTVDNISEEPIPITIAAAPASQSRIDAIVVYVTNPPQGTTTATDNYGAVGVLDVQGATSGSPVAPNDSDIRTAITADGQSGANAYYVVIAYVTVGTGTTDITGNMITQGEPADLQSSLVEIPDGSITGAKLEDATVTGTKIANSTITDAKINWSSINRVNYTDGTEVVIGTFGGKPVYRQIKTFTTGTVTDAQGISWTTGATTILSLSGVITTLDQQKTIPFYWSSTDYGTILYNVNTSTLYIKATSSYNNRPLLIVMDYLKN